MPKITKSKPKKIVKIFKGDVYRRDLIFVSGCSLQEAEKAVKKYKIKGTFGDKVADTSLGIFTTFNENDSPNIAGTILFVWIRDIGDYYTLVHEITHLCVKVFELSNMDIDGHTTEAFAFYHEFWVRKLWRIMS